MRLEGLCHAGLRDVHCDSPLGGADAWGCKARTPSGHPAVTEPLPSNSLFAVPDSLNKCWALAVLAPGASDARSSRTEQPAARGAGRVAGRRCLRSQAPWIPSRFPHPRPQGAVRALGASGSRGNTW